MISHLKERISGKEQNILGEGNMDARTAIKLAEIDFNKIKDELKELNSISIEQRDDYLRVTGDIFSTIEGILRQNSALAVDYTPLKDEVERTISELNEIPSDRDIAQNAVMLKQGIAMSESERSKVEKSLQTKLSQQRQEAIAREFKEEYLGEKEVQQEIATQQKQEQQKEQETTKQNRIKGFKDELKDIKNSIKKHPEKAMKNLSIWSRSLKEFQTGLSESDLDTREKVANLLIEGGELQTKSSVKAIKEEMKSGKEDIAKLQKSLEKLEKGPDHSFLVAGLITLGAGLGLAGAVGAEMSGLGMAAMAGVSTVFAPAVTIALATAAVIAIGVGIGMLVDYAIRQGQQESMQR